MMNPIIQRELVTLLRTKRALFLQLALVVVLGLLVVLRWPSEGTVDLSGEQSQGALRLFGYGLMVALILLAPVFPATTVVRERQQGTLALLLNSPMSPWSIFWGKLLGVLGYVLLLIVLSLPAAAACYTMGGVDPSQLVKVYAVLILLAVQYATLGLLISSYANSTDAALRFTYGAILVLGVVTMGPYQFLQGIIGDQPLLLGLVDWLRCLSPIPAMMEALNQGALGGQGLQGGGGVAARYALLAIVTSAIFSIWTAARFNMRIFDRARAAGTMTEDRSASAQTFRRVMFLIDPSRRSELIGVRWGAMLLSLVLAAAIAAGAVALYRSGLELLGLPAGMILAVALGVVSAACVGAFLVLVASVNPVVVKEMRTRRFGRGHWLIRIGAICVLLSMGLTYIASTGTINWGVATIGAILVLMQVSLIILLTPSLAAGLISGERESGGWTLLQMTPVSPVRIVWGKLVSVAMPLLFILVATLPGYGVMLWIDESQAKQVIQVLITLLLTAAFALLLSAAVSSLFRRTAVATAVSYTLLVALCAGTMLVWAGRDAPFTQSTVEAVLRFNPLAAALRLIRAPGFTDYQLVPTNWWFMSVACAVFLLILVVQTWRLTRPR